MVEQGSAPVWLSALEQKLEAGKTRTLGHDTGAGSPCNHCGPTCPGLNLHFWRKICRECHCSKDVHDIPNEDISGWAQFELLGGSKLNRKLPMIKIRGLTDEPVRMDWMPLNASLDVVSDYMSCLGEKLAPVSGTPGAAKRRELLRRQVPLHDYSADLSSANKQTQEEQDGHKEYIAEIKNNLVGQGNIYRIGGVKKGEVGIVDVKENKPVYGQTKSYSLPMRVSSISKGVKYCSVPKNSTDKYLTLDKLGNVINKSAHLPDFKESPLISKPVKDKLNLMRIESDRIKSAVEHGPVYDKMFSNMKQLKIPFESDVYLMPIKSFRDQFKIDPKFKNETTEFVKAQGVEIMPDSLNDNTSPRFPKKGTIYAPNGEIWSWSTEDDDGNSLMDQNISIDGGREQPPPLNYDTYPGAVGPGDSNDVLNVNTTPAKIRVKPEVPLNKPSMHMMNPKSSEEGQLSDGITGLHIQHPSADFENPIASSCKRCSKPFLSGEIAVKAERAGPHVAWHPQCFSCLKCGNLLADLLYFYHEGEVYCGRDLAEVLNIKRCAACDELIFSKKSTVAEGKYFHLKHFCCYHCDIPLGGKKYVPDDKSNQPICLDCYEKIYANTCNTCSSIIKPDQQGVSWSNIHWHGTCFNCTSTNCNKSLLGCRFIVKNNKPFCSPTCLQEFLSHA